MKYVDFFLYSPLSLKEAGIEFRCEFSKPMVCVRVCISMCI